VTRGVRVVDQPNKVTVVEDVVVVQVAAGIQGPQGPQGVQGPPGLDGTGAPVFGQVAKMTSGTITIATQGVYQSTGLTAVLDGENAGISLGTSDLFAIKNTSGATRRLKISASYDASMAGATKVLGLALAINGVVDLDTECRATTGLQGAIAKLATAWIIDLADGDEVALFVANHSSTVDIDFQRGRIVATSVAGFGPQGPQGAAGEQREARSDYVDPYSYIGVAPTGSLESAPVWTITRIEIDDPIVVTVATGVAWDDRLIAAYS
jgi:hypothetical protein